MIRTLTRIAVDPMCRAAKNPYLCVTGLSAFLLAAPAFAHGGISSLGALQDMMLLMLGGLGLLFVGTTWYAVRQRRKNEDTTTAAKTAVVFAFIYLFFALPLVLALFSSGFAKFPALMCVVIIVMLTMFFMNRQQRNGPQSAGHSDVTQ